MYRGEVQNSTYAKVYFDSSYFKEGPDKLVGTSLSEGKNTQQVLSLAMARRETKGRLTNKGQKKMAEILKIFRREEKNISKIKWDTKCGCNMCPCSPGYRLYVPSRDRSTSWLVISVRENGDIVFRYERSHRGARGVSNSIERIGELKHLKNGKPVNKKKKPIIHKDDSYEKIRKFLRNEPHNVRGYDFLEDPSGTFYYSRYYSDGTQVDLYATPNFLYEGRMGFQVYVDEQLVKEYKGIKFNKMTVRQYEDHCRKKIPTLAQAKKFRKQSLRRS